MHAPSRPFAPPFAAANPFRVLWRHRNFRLFWVGQTLSLVGTWMQSMARGWLALDISDSAFLVGLVSAVGALPILLLSLPAGVLVDRTDKLRLVIAAQSLLLVEAAVLFWLTSGGHVTIGVLLGLAALDGVVLSVEIPARQSLMVELVRRKDLPDAIALNSSGFNLARIVGPTAAAVVTARLGIAWCFGLNAASFVAVLAGLLLIRLPDRTLEPSDAPPLHALREGLAYVWRTPPLRTLVGLTAVYGICGIPYLTLMPVIARDVLGAGVSGYGVLLASLGTGGLAGALFLAGPGRRLPRGAMLHVACFAFPALLLAFAAARGLASAGALLFLVGAAMILTNALANGLLQSLVADAMRGRLMALYSLVVVGLAQVAGAFGAGAVARAVGARAAVAAGAVVMLLYAAGVSARRPELRRL